MNVLSKTILNKQANEFSRYGLGEFLLENERAAVETDSVDTMYQYIDMPQLVNAFYRKLKKSYQIDHIEVRLPQMSFQSGLSVPGLGSYKQSYQVKCDQPGRNRRTAKIILYRGYRFQFSELAKLEALIHLFSGPFKNAVLYANACHAASHDCLTDLYNRNAFNECLSNNNSNGAYRGLIVCDIDNFKAINDQHSHLAGDEVLIQFARILQVVSSSKNLVFRYGGDEFVIVHSKNCGDSARQIAKCVRSTVENTPVIIDGHPLNLTTTVGVSDVLQGELLETAFHRADRALLRGKKHGRNQVFLAGAAA